MRFKLYFSLENSHFPIDYRRSLLSFIKLSLSEYSEEYYKKLYNRKDNIIKPFTFCTYFHLPQFEKEEIILSDKNFEMTISTADYNVGIVLYNSMNHQRNRSFAIEQNVLTLKDVVLVAETTIRSNHITVQFLSPLIVRDRNQETRKDFYYSHQHKNFLPTMKLNIKKQLEITDLPLEIVDKFEIQPIQAKKTVIRFYEKQIEGSIGTFQISGDSKLLQFLYQSGLGSKHSAGFGMFKVLEERR